MAERGDGCSSHCHDLKRIAENTIGLFEKSLHPYHIIYDFSFDESLIVDSNFVNTEKKFNDTIKVFSGDQINLSGFLSPELEGLSHFEIQFKSKMSNESGIKALQHKVSVPVNNAIHDSSLHKILATELINKLSKIKTSNYKLRGKIEKRITELSLNNQILSEYTSFFGVIKQNPNKDLSTFKVSEEEFKRKGPLINQRIQIFVQTFIGTSITINTFTLSTVENLKELIQKKLRIPPDQQRILYAGIQLEDGRALIDYKIGDCSTLHLKLRLRGGGISSSSFNIKSQNRSCQHQTLRV